MSATYKMHIIDYGIIILYLGILLFLGFKKRLGRNSSASDVIVGGRMLTLPAFVASLVSTWYGGILGVGEYSYSYGLSNWLVFGFPYYLAAFFFALFLAKKARKSEVLTIPDRLLQVYDKKTAVAGSVIIYFMTVPAAYVLMLGTLANFLFGWDLWVGIIIGTLFSLIYVFVGGFNSVVRTDIFQFGLMFLGFILLLIVLYSTYGGLSFLQANLPESHFSWHGGNSLWYIVSWYGIALAALIEPTFHQRCYAAKNGKIAKNGIYISIACWAFFDFLTTTCGMYARAILPNLDNPVGSYPALAMKVLPVGFMGLFALAMLATIMSTVDSNAFVAASTFSRDIVMRIFNINEKKTVVYTRIGLIVTMILAIVPLFFFESVIDIWHIFGSVGTPALLVPIFFSYVGTNRLPAKFAFISIISSGGLSLLWYLSKQISDTSDYLFAVEPIFPGLILSLCIFIVFAKKQEAVSLVAHN